MYDQVHVSITVGLVFRRDGVRGEQRGPYLQGQGFLQALGHAEHLQLAFKRKAVAALDLHGHGALAHHLLHACLGGGVEFFLAHRTQLGRAVEYATAFRGDLLVAQPVDAVHELAFARCGEHGMRMRVAPARQHIAIGGIDHLQAVPIGDARPVGIGAHGGDDAVLRHQPALLHLRQLPHGGTGHPVHARGMRAYQCLCVLDQQSFSAHRLRSTAWARELPTQKGAKAGFGLDRIKMGVWGRTANTGCDPFRVVARGTSKCNML